MSAVIVKKEEKVGKVFEALGGDASEENFIEKFKEMYPEDWERVNAKYNKEERHTKPGKSHPMPHPDIYMKNLYKVAIEKKNKQRKGRETL